MQNFPGEMREMRRAVRMRVELPARYVSERLTIDGLVTDLSPDGVFFCSDYLDATGEQVRVSIDIPWRSQPLQLRGEVRWVSEVSRVGGMGIRFMDVSFEDRVVLSSLGLASQAEAGQAASPT
jgi:Tfp pilus assembly protein PilZ